MSDAHAASEPVQMLGRGVWRLRKRELPGDRGGALGFLDGLLSGQMGPAVPLWSDMLRPLNVKTARASVLKEGPPVKCLLFYSLSSRPIHQEEPAPPVFVFPNLRVPKPFTHMCTRLSVLVLFRVGMAGGMGAGGGGES